LGENLGVKRTLQVCRAQSGGGNDEKGEMENTRKTKKKSSQPEPENCRAAMTIKPTWEPIKNSILAGKGKRKG